MNFLEEIRQARALRDETLDRRSDAPPRDLAAALRGRRTLSIIAEIKCASPTRGPLGDSRQAVERARSYEAGGAAAISVVTEPRFFHGTLEMLACVAEAVSLPVLMKDFIFDRGLLEAGARAGASGALLIVRLLDEATLGELIHTAHELGLTALVECRDTTEIDRARSAGATLIGVNNRDLQTLEMTKDLAFRLLGDLPDGIITVAESGYHSPEDLNPLRGRVDAVLIGSALMRRRDAEAALREFAPCA